MTQPPNFHKELRILLVDDFSLFVEGIQALLEREGFSQVKIATPSVADLQGLLASEKPDVLVLAHTLSGVSGIDAAEQVLATYPEQKILLVLMKVSESQVTRILRMGVKGIVVCDSHCSELVSAVQRVSEGRTFMSQTVNEIMLGQFYQAGPASGERTSNPLLSARELEVMRLLALGYPNREVAERLHISVRTVDSHRSHILQKIEGGSTADLVRYALREDIVSLDEQRT